MKWTEVKPEAQSEWLSDPVTQSYLARLQEERDVSHNAALMTMRNAMGSGETLAQACRHVGQLDAYNKAIEIATRIE